MIEINWLIRAEMPGILAIENESFEFPWSEEDFDKCLVQRNNIGMVARLDGELAGFMIYELMKDRLSLSNFAVSKQHRRMGVGTAMVEKLVSKLSPERRKHIDVFLRESNLPAQMFFKRSGFFWEETLKGTYEETDEDCYRMTYNLIPRVINRISSRIN